MCATRSSPELRLQFFMPDSTKRDRGVQATVSSSTGDNNGPSSRSVSSESRPFSRPVPRHASPLPTMTLMSAEESQKVSERQNMMVKKILEEGGDPAGWRVEGVMRTQGVNSGRYDMYYISPCNTKRLRSINEVLHYLQLTPVDGSKPKTRPAQLPPPDPAATRSKGESNKESNKEAKSGARPIRVSATTSRNAVPASNLAAVKAFEVEQQQLKDDPEAFKNKLWPVDPEAAAKVEKFERELAAGLHPVACLQRPPVGVQEFAHRVESVMSDILEMNRKSCMLMSAAVDHVDAQFKPVLHAVSMLCNVSEPPPSAYDTVAREAATFKARCVELMKGSVMEAVGATILQDALVKELRKMASEVQNESKTRALTAAALQASLGTLSRRLQATNTAAASAAPVAGPACAASAPAVTSAQTAAAKLPNGAPLAAAGPAAARRAPVTVQSAHTASAGPHAPAATLAAGTTPVYASGRSLTQLTAQAQYSQAPEAHAPPAAGEAGSAGQAAAPTRILVRRHSCDAPPCEPTRAAGAADAEVVMVSLAAHGATEGSLRSTSADASTVPAVASGEPQGRPPLQRAGEIGIVGSRAAVEGTPSVTIVDASPEQSKAGGTHTAVDAAPSTPATNRVEAASNPSKGLELVTGSTERSGALLPPKASDAEPARTISLAAGVGEAPDGRSNRAESRADGALRPPSRSELTRSISLSVGVADAAVGRSNSNAGKSDKPGQDVRAMSGPDCGSEGAGQPDRMDAKLSNLLVAAGQRHLHSILSMNHTQKRALAVSDAPRAAKRFAPAAP